MIKRWSRLRSAGWGALFGAAFMMIEMAIDGTPRDPAAVADVAVGLVGGMAGGAVLCALVAVLHNQILQAK
jgi:hypothetical protein